MVTSTRMLWGHTYLKIYPMNGLLLSLKQLQPALAEQMVSFRNRALQVSKLHKLFYRSCKEANCCEEVESDQGVLGCACNGDAVHHQKNLHCMHII